MSISTVDGCIGSTKQNHPYYKVAAATTNGVGTFFSLWKIAGMPGAGATPTSGSGDVPTNSTAGSLAQTNPGAGNTLYLGALNANIDENATLTIYDRLVETSGLSGTVTGAQTVSTVALTRYTSGVDVELWLEWYTATGTTPVTVTASYTNQAGTSGQTTTSVTIPASPVAGHMIQLPLAAGDTGVQAVASVTLSATTGTAGNFGVTLLRRLADLPTTGVNISAQMDAIALGLPQIQSNACLAGMLFNSVTAGNGTGNVYSSITTFEG